MNTESRKATERSPNFPFVSLQAALERALQFFSEEKRGSAPFAVAAQHWNYSPASSGALQTAAAMKSYGLMADEGGGPGRKLKLTELALRILLDNRPESIEREQYKRQAALTPNVAADVYQKWEGQLPSEATLNHYLVLELGFNQSTALRAVSILLKNEEFTKSGAGDFQSVHNESVVVPKNEQQNPEVTFQMHPGNPAPILTSKMPAGGMSIETIKGANNQDIIMQFAGAPTIEQYEFLKDYIDLRIKVLKRGQNGSPKEEEK